MRLVLLVLAATAVVRAADTCYYAAGQKALQNYVPCSSGSGISSCCLAGDFCLQDGACFGPGTKMTYLAGCTDPTFQDPSCKGGAGVCNKNTQFQGIARCDGDNWVCCQGEGQTGDIPSNSYANSCPCDAATVIAGSSSLAAVASLGTSIPSAAPTTAASTSKAAQSGNESNTPSSASPTQTTLSVSINPNAGITGSGPSAATSQASSSGGSSGSSNTGLKVGLGVGIPLGLAVIGGVAAAIFFFRRRLMNREPQYVTQADMSTPVWMGEAPGSGMPNRNSGGFSGTAENRPASQGIWQNKQGA